MTDSGPCDLILSLREPSIRCQLPEGHHGPHIPNLGEPLMSDVCGAQHPYAEDDPKNYGTPCDYPKGHGPIADDEGDLWDHAYRFEGIPACHWTGTLEAEKARRQADGVLVGRAVGRLHAWAKRPTWVALGTAVAEEANQCTCGVPSGVTGHEQYCGLEGPVIQGAEEDMRMLAALVNAIPALKEFSDWAVEQKDERLTDRWLIVLTRIGAE